MSLAAKEVPLDLFGCSPARSRVDSPGVDSAGKKAVHLERNGTKCEYKQDNANENKKTRGPETQSTNKC